MHIFSTPRNKIKAQETTTRHPRQYQSTSTLSATPAERKRFTVLLPQSVKTLFSKRSSVSSLAPQPLSTLPSSKVDQHLYTPENIYVRPATARAASAAFANVPRMESFVRMQSASNTFPGRGRSSVYSACEEEEYFTSDDAAGCSDRHSQARAKALAETVRRLQKARSPGPLTPSSVSTGKTLPCFPEHEEEEYDEDNDHYQQLPETVSVGEADGNTSKLVARSRVSCVVAGTGTLTASAISTASLKTLAARNSRPSSMVVDTSCKRNSSISSSTKSSKSGSSTLSPATASSTHSQSVLNASDESLTRTLPGTPRQEKPARSNSSLDKQKGLGYSVQQQQTHWSSSSDESVESIAEAERPSALEAKRQKYQQQRYSVAMSQNLSRRFQERATHEYEQRIYCLQAHHSDTVDRMEARAQKDADHIRQLEEQLCELRKTNADLTKSVQQLRNNAKRTTTSQSVAPKPPVVTSISSSSFALAHQANISKKLIEFMDHYQEDVRRLKRETNTAQEWVIALAELVVGPKKERQSWDEWLNSCLDILQKR
ncbi:hypothetical protein EV175_001644 [Coemansia sp. RSA 1933]|nr:hypothetical protein EV175_001644 [Coemansia sp. RSA 1933]